MKKWEDIVRDKMEEPEGTLPESVFAEFNARRNATAAAPAPKRFPLVWMMVPAVAAGLAAVLFFRQPSVQEDGIQIIRQPSDPVAVSADSTMAFEQEQGTSLIAHTVAPKAVRPYVNMPQQVIPVDAADDDSAEEGITTSLEDKSISTTVNSSPETKPAEETKVKESVIITSSPFLPEKKIVKAINMRVAPAAGVIAGGGLLAAVIAPVHGSGVIEDRDLTTLQWDSSDGKDVRTGDYNHYFPLKLGLSARFPIRERISITTGVDYSWYKSSFTYSLSGEKIQNAYYLGIPVRLDWTMVSNKWLDVYLGGGFEGDWCVGASLDGNRISKDGFSASLQGAGGLQFKPTKYVGLYLEPQLNWRFASEKTALDTYRSENPIMFLVATGLRFTFGK